MGLTADQLSRLRRKLGDTGALQGFTDVELQDLYTEADEDWNTTIRDAYEELVANSWRFYNYSQGSSRESQQEIFENLRKQLAYWNTKVTGVKSTVKIVGRRMVPPDWKEKP
jgi:hypothetical protein